MNTNLIIHIFTKKPDHVLCYIIKLVYLLILLEFLQMDGQVLLVSDLQKQQALVCENHLIHVALFVHMALSLSELLHYLWPGRYAGDGQFQQSC